MTQAYDSTAKRTELVRAAKALFHLQGYHRTTLEKVSQRSQVPLGNVHYYFSSKRSLAEAVIASHLQDLRAGFASWEGIDDPAERLKLLVRSPLGASDSVTKFGCPHGSLCQELGKLDDSPLGEAGAELLVTWVSWARQQFAALGWNEEESLGLAQQLVASLQGTMLLAQAFRSAEVLAQQLGRVEAWLEEKLQSRGERN